jgi:hypothetical protein
VTNVSPDSDNTRGVPHGRCCPMAAAATMTVFPGLPPSEQSNHDSEKP